MAANALGPVRSRDDVALRAHDRIDVEVFKALRRKGAGVRTQPLSRCPVHEDLDGAAARGFAGAEVEEQVKLQARKTSLLHARGGVFGEHDSHRFAAKL